MGLDNSYNQSRVNAIVKALSLVDKSAKSNRSNADEVRALLDPVYQQLRDMGAASNDESKAPAETPPQSEPVAETERRPIDWKGRCAGGKNPPRWAHMRDMVNSLSRKELSTCLSYIQVRIDEELN